MSPAAASCHGRPMASSVCIYIDLSNIYMAGREVASHREGMAAYMDLRIHFRSLVRLAAADRNVLAAVCVSSAVGNIDPVVDHLRAVGVEPEIYERGQESGREQAVDQSLQVHMLRAALDVEPPGVAVLLTGDGAGYMEGVGFFADLERMHRCGWGVELLSWDRFCNRHLREWVREHGVYVPLEDWYKNVTFREGEQRVVQPFSLDRRPVAEPGK